MNIKNYRHRIIDAKINEYLKIFGAILIEGPKWCGKTWTSKNNCKSEFLVASPSGNFNNRTLAKVNPMLVLEGDKPKLIDEWQEVPSLWDAVRGYVDDTTEKGNFILTGSASINKESYIHSGTGRIGRIRMRPMTLYESGKSNGIVSLKDICYGKAKDSYTGDVKLDTIIENILIGGWPANLNLNIEQSILVAREYVKSIINEDIFKIDGIKRDKHKIELLLKSLARNEATTVSNNTIKKDIQAQELNNINIDTISEYLNLLNNLYLTENLPPYSNKIRSSLRVKQSEKRHFVDPSLPCAILNLRKEHLLNDLEFLGFLFESMVERDLLTYSEAFYGKLYHYQDYNGNEIDAVIELEDGSWCAFEIKLGANQIESAAKNLLSIKEKIEKTGGNGPKHMCVICGLSNAAYMREDGVYVVPITALKD